MMKIRKIRHLPGSVMRSRNALGIAPMKGPKTGIMFVMPMITLITFRFKQQIIRFYIAIQINRYVCAQKKAAAHKAPPKPEAYQPCTLSISPISSQVRG